MRTNDLGMKRIGVISDTHGVLPDKVFSFFEPCDELWHCGDIGSGVLDELERFRPVRAVYGNIDDQSMRQRLQQTLLFTCEGQRVLMTHIGGWPDHYPSDILRLLQIEKPDIFVCGHSHILKVMYDKRLNMLHINPGAAGRQGWQRVSTLVRFTIDGTPSNLEICEWPR